QRPQIPRENNPGRGLPFQGSTMRKFPRRNFLHLAAGAAALATVSRIARAQAYPSRPVRVIVPATAGGGYDIVARLMGQWLSERLGPQILIDKKPGGGTNIRPQAGVGAGAGWHTPLLGAHGKPRKSELYEKLNFNFIRDIAAVAGIISLPEVMVIHPSVPAKTIPDFIAYAKANPGKISMASGGIGTPGHLSGELFKTMTGVNMVHVPYRGVAPALTDLLGGQVQVGFVSVPSSIEHIRTGKLRALAVTTAKRAEALPDIPTFAEFVPGYEASFWYGVGAPKATPAE